MKVDSHKCLNSKNVHAIFLVFIQLPSYGYLSRSMLASTKMCNNHYHAHHSDMYSLLAAFLLEYLFVQLCATIKPKVFGISDGLVDVAF